MSFTPNMPQSGQTLGQTRRPFESNFFTLRSSQSAAPYGVGDHMDVNNGQLPPGRHKWVRMPDVNADIPAAVASLFSFYVKDAPASQIYYREPGGNQIKFTNDYFQVTGPSPTTYIGYTLPIIGGLMMKIGQVKVPAASLTTYSFATVTGSDFTASVFYYATGNGAVETILGTAVTTTTFDVAGLDKDAWISFLAIGI